jgi:hypothetical protein
MATTTMTAATMTVKIQMNPKSSPAGKLADVELHFTGGPLAGTKLIGFGCPRTLVCSDVSSH